MGGAKYFLNIMKFGVATVQQLGYQKHGIKVLST